MPQKNVRKEFMPNSYYHVYSHLVPELGNAFNDVAKAFMIKLFGRHLSNEKQYDQYGAPIKNYSYDISLLAYCLMDNHFHLLIYQRDETAMTNFMKSFSTSLSIFMNDYLDRRGTVFESAYKAVHINSDGQFLHISRYIHTNPGKSYYKKYEYSSYRAYVNLIDTPGWLKPEPVLKHFNSVGNYIDFCRYTNWKV